MVSKSPKQQILRQNAERDCSVPVFAMLAGVSVDLRTVQELMGHKSIQMTVRYSHLTPKHTLAAVEMLAGTITVIPTDTRTDTESKEPISVEARHIH
jgi:hypothetical protein